MTMTELELLMKVEAETKRFIVSKLSSCMKKVWLMLLASWLANWDIYTLIM